MPCVQHVQKTIPRAFLAWSHSLLSFKFSLKEKIMDSICIWEPSTVLQEKSPKTALRNRLLSFACCLLSTITQLAELLICKRQVAGSSSVSVYFTAVKKRQFPAASCRFSATYSRDRFRAMRAWRSLFESSLTISSPPLTISLVKGRIWWKALQFPRQIKFLYI